MGCRLLSSACILAGEAEGKGGALVGAHTATVKVKVWQTLALPGPDVRMQLQGNVAMSQPLEQQAMEMAAVGLGVLAEGDQMDVIAWLQGLHITLPCKVLPVLLGARLGRKVHWVAFR